ncbi:Uncharacterised protein [Mycobacteroides abscessus subsp. massiliense]|nr:Uncharacterised protein [Mycobacteroides abscessus subsp. massiliense]
MRQVAATELVALQPSHLFGAADFRQIFFAGRTAALDDALGDFGELGVDRSGGIFVCAFLIFCIGCFSDGLELWE